MPESPLETGKRLLLRRAEIVTGQEAFVWHSIAWELECVLLVYLDFLRQVRVVFTPTELEQAAIDPAALQILEGRIREALRAAL